MQLLHRFRRPSLGLFLASQHQMIGDMIRSDSLKQREMADAARCSERGIQRIARNLRHYGTTKAPPNGSAGRRRIITPQMLDALREHLLEKPGLYQDEIAIFLYDKLGVLVTIPNISRTLKSIGWTKKATRHVAGEQNPERRDYYLHNLSEFRSYHLVYVDESGCDKRIGLRRTGWSPLGVSPVQVTAFHRDSRYHILPAYTQDVILFSRVFQGTTDGIVYEDFIEQLLHHCRPYPEPYSFLVMDNASFHHSDRIKEMCRNAGRRHEVASPDAR
jgi:transposase